MAQEHKNKEQFSKEQKELIAKWVYKRGNQLLGGVYDGSYHIRHIFDVLEYEIKNGEIK